MNFILENFMVYGTLPIIFVIGLIIAIEDFRHGKIRNKWIKWGIFLGLVYYLIVIIIGLLVSFNIIELGSFFNFQYYFWVLINTVIAFILGFVLWYFKLWAGGDAKLFTLLVFLVPLVFYSYPYIIIFPAFNLLVNIILPIFAYLILRLISYPILLLLNYLKNPALLKEYYQNYKKGYSLDKTKIRQYLISIFSFLIILILFQILRLELRNYFFNYLGGVVIAFYFFIGFLIFRPLKIVLKKRFVIAVIIIGIYFIVSYFLYQEKLYSDLYQIFAIQMIFMLAYYVIFRYSGVVGRFFYNSAEVKLVPILDIQAGQHINKDFISKLMGFRAGFKEDEFKKVLDEKEFNRLEEIINKRQISNSSIIGRIINDFKIFNLPKIVKDYSLLKKEKKLETEFLQTISTKVGRENIKGLENLLKQTDEVHDFLKTIKGKLTFSQANELKQLIIKRNQEIENEGLEPIKHIVLHKTFSFAPFMLLGVIITILTRSSIVHMVYEYILHR